MGRMVAVMVDTLLCHDHFGVHSDRVSRVLVAVPQRPAAARNVDTDAVAFLEYDSDGQELDFILVDLLRFNQ